MEEKIEKDNMIDYVKTNSGFSIEIENPEYKLVGSHNGLNCYEIYNFIMGDIAIVSDPAHGSLAVINNEEMEYIGAVAIPDEKMYRNPNETIKNPHYVFFTKSGLEKMKNEFFKNKRKITIGHKN